MVKYPDRAKKCLTAKNARWDYYCCGRSADRKKGIREEEAKKQEGYEAYDLWDKNCQHYIEDVIELGDEIARLFGDTIYIKKP